MEHHPIKKIVALALIVFAAGWLIGAKTALYDAVLATDMDAAHHHILNLPPDQPLPPPVEGPSPPTAWLGNLATQAAQGNLTEYVANKGVANGYASLDSTTKVPLAQLPVLAGTGTVTSVGVTTANGISATGGPITTSGNFTFSLGFITPSKVSLSATDGSSYYILPVQTGIPIETNPHLYSVSGGYLSYYGGTATNSHNLFIGATTLTADRTINFPDHGGTVIFASDTMVGVGPSHSVGLVPDPGASGTTTDYLARDGTWKTQPAGPTYQPVAPAPVITASTNTTGAKNITLSDSLAGAAIFYDIASTTGPFIPYTGGTISLAPTNTTIFAYAASPGYTNSAMSNFTNENP